MHEWTTLAYLRRHRYADEFSRIQILLGGDFMRNVLNARVHI